MIAFGPWLPDQPDVSGPHLITAENVIPASDHYRPFKAFAIGSAALSTPPVRGAVAFSDANATVHVFAGDETKLYELQSDTSWLDCTRLVGGAYACGLTSRWRFTQFGDTAIASNFDDDIQARTMSIPGTFEDLAGSPPRAKHLCTFKDFFFYGFTTTSAAEVGWSGINDPTYHTTGSNQCDRQILPDGGDLQGFAPTDAALLIFQQTKIRILQYVGPPVIMQIDPFEEKVGCLESNSIAYHGKKVFFLAPDGFYQIDSFQPAVNIGEGILNEWFFNDVNASYYYRMSSAVDPQRQLVVWCYPSQASPSGAPDTQLFYYWPKRRWSYVRTPTELVFNSLGLGYTLEDLDAIALTGIDDFAIPLDDPLLRGGALRFGAFDHDAKYGVFAGANLEATLEAGDFELMKGKRAYVSGVRPVVDSDEVTVSCGFRERVADASVYTADGTLESHGMASLEGEGRYGRVKIVIAEGADWTKAQGYDFDAVPAGDV